jgi:hypothetical protein
MAETAEQYRQRFARYLDGKDHLAMQQSAPLHWHGSSMACPKKTQAQTGSKKWSVLEILAHLVEDELTSSVIAR